MDQRNNIGTLKHTIQSVDLQQENEGNSMEKEYFPINATGTNKYRPKLSQK